MDCEFKPLYETPIEWLEKLEPWELNIETNKTKLTEEQRDTLQWARDFMNNYEKKRKRNV